MSKYTPGPWEVQEILNVHNFEAEVSNVRLVHSCRGDVAYAAYLAKDGDTAEQLANARLISAAPDLLEALLEARERMMGSSPAIKRLIAKTDAAIAKATKS